MIRKKQKPAPQSTQLSCQPQLPVVSPKVSGGSGFSHFDRRLHSALARLTGGVSPYAITRAWSDWAIHSARAPGRQAELLLHAVKSAQRVAQYATDQGGGQESVTPFQPKGRDPRFDHPGWEYPPFSIWKQSFLAAQDWWHTAASNIRGMEESDTDRLQFLARQMLDVASPSNVPWMNPAIIEATLRTGGRNLFEGAKNLWADYIQTATQARKPVPKGYEIGKDLACTRGEVIYRNDIFELIQYCPQTVDVHPDPVLIVPAWIMKYYILDLSPHNSLVNYLVQHGFTVFMISWCNPTAEQAELTLEDYRRRGVMAAIDAIGQVLPDAKIHANGYCLGGTILAIAAATMARDGDDRLASVTLMAAQVDFVEAGELLLFLDESQVSFLEDLMWDQGYLDRPQMAGTFAAIRAEDLIYTRAVRRYFLGEKDLPTDMGVWNGDATRMPARMHSEYLRSLFLENRLSAGRFAVEGPVIALKDIAVQMFVVGTENDHIAPWRSVYKVALFTDADLTFVLSSGGHNGGIVNEPGHPGRHYRIGRRHKGDLYVGPDRWIKSQFKLQGSWWPFWVEWLEEQQDARTTPPKIGATSEGLHPICKAPGTYVYQ